MRKFFRFTKSRFSIIRKNSKTSKLQKTPFRVWKEFELKHRKLKSVMKNYPYAKNWQNCEACERRKVWCWRISNTCTYYIKSWGVYFSGISACECTFDKLGPLKNFAKRKSSMLHYHDTASCVYHQKPIKCVFLSLSLQC